MNFIILMIALIRSDISSEITETERLYIQKIKNANRAFLYIRVNEKNEIDSMVII